MHRNTYSNGKSRGAYIIDFYYSSMKSTAITDK